jgi:hypothetical protein
LNKVKESLNVGDVMTLTVMARRHHAHHQRNAGRGHAETTTKTSYGGTDSENAA